MISHSEVRCLFAGGFGLSPLRQHEFSFIVLFLHFSLSPFSSFDHEVKPNGRPMRAFSARGGFFGGRAKCDISDSLSLSLSLSDIRHTVSTVE